MADPDLTGDITVTDCRGVVSALATGCAEVVVAVNPLGPSDMLTAIPMAK